MKEAAVTPRVEKLVNCFKAAKPEVFAERAVLVRGHMPVQKANRCCCGAPKCSKIS
jgi:hypothetical protein